MPLSRNACVCVCVCAREPAHAHACVHSSTILGHSRGIVHMCVTVTVCVNVCSHILYSGSETQFCWVEVEVEEKHYYTRLN